MGGKVRIAKQCKHTVGHIEFKENNERNGRNDITSQAHRKFEIVKLKATVQSKMIFSYAISR